MHIFRSITLSTAMLMALFCAVPQVSAQTNSGETPSADMIYKALTRHRRGASAETSARATIHRLREVGQRRGLNLQEREDLAHATSGLPQVDLTVYFDFDSAELKPPSLPVLNALGTALGRLGASRGTIVVSGHTDAKGTAAYNQQLSLRRAEAVASYLAQKFNIDSNGILTAGYGSEQLINVEQPMAGENRRVQIVNAGP